MQPDLPQGDVFIPVLPEKPVQKSSTLVNALPGFLLMLSVIGRRPATVGELLFNVFCFVAGIAVISVAIRSYKLAKVWKGADTIIVLSGLLLIAQGSLMFDALKGFQPAHLYFITATIFIFKGYLFPASTIRRGFLITDDHIIASITAVKQTVKIERENLEELNLIDDVLNFIFNDGTEITIKMEGVVNKQEVLDSLKTELFDNPDRVLL